MEGSKGQWMRITLGVFLIIYALNQFLHVMPTSYGAMPESTRDFLDSILQYLPMLYIFEMIVGAMLIFNKWTTLVLIMLVPLSVTFLMFNFINGSIAFLWPAIVVAGLNLLLLVSRKDKFNILLD